MARGELLRVNRNLAREEQHADECSPPGLRKKVRELEEEVKSLKEDNIKQV